MASSSITLQTLHQGALLRSNFLGQKTLNTKLHKPSYFSVPKDPRFNHKTCAKFDLSQLLGGRGLCNGEEGLEKELKRTVEPAMSSSDPDGKGASSGSQLPEGVPEDGFDKEMMGLTGGFPGGEKGLQKFVEENPPPPKTTDSGGALAAGITTAGKKPKAPELPLLMPGMIALVKNPNSPYYMYCGIVQRITDGKAGVLLEGGVWDRLITFRLDELERREKGPPGKNPRSVVLETTAEKDS